ncbi:MAG: hypothetical protein R3B84_10150 [Zavarzinella sp.]
MGRFSHPCGFDSREIPSLIVELNSDCERVNLHAANKLWNVISHQGNVGSNSVPTLPFLIERLATSSIVVQSEILDIIFLFSCAACPKNAENWAVELRALLTANRTHFERLLESQNEEITSYAELILEKLDATSCKHIDH